MSSCQSLYPQLSPYLDGELEASSKVGLEKHISACARCQNTVADLRASQLLLKDALAREAEQVDFSRFAQTVLERLGESAHRPVGVVALWIEPVGAWFTRVATALTAPRMIAVGAAAAVLLVIALSGFGRLGNTETQDTGYAEGKPKLESVQVDEGSRVVPVVLETRDGDAIVYAREENTDASTSADVPMGGEL